MLGERGYLPIRQTLKLDNEGRQMEGGKGRKGKIVT